MEVFDEEKLMNVLKLVEDQTDAPNTIDEKWVLSQKEEIDSKIDPEDVQQPKFNCLNDY